MNRRHSLVEGYKLHLLATMIDKVPVPSRSKSEDGQQCTKLVTEMMAQRLRSSIQTSQGVQFEDKHYKHQLKLYSLIALAADPYTSTINARIAQKALKYRNKSYCKKGWK